MTQLKQKTVHGQTVTLHQLKNTLDSGGKWMYEVRIDGSLEQRFTRKREAKREFKDTLHYLDRAHQAEQEDDGLFSMF